MEFLTAIWSWVGFASLVLLPGAWLAGRVRDTSPGERLGLAMALTPLVLGLQLYLVRFLGASFPTAVQIVAAGNLPAAVLLARGLRRPSRAALIGVSVGALVLALPATCLLWHSFHDLPRRLFTGHSWLHADTVAFLAQGELLPEEAELAGVRQTYPWLGHLYQAALSQMLDIAAVESYRFTNLAWTILMAGFVGAYARRLGSGWRGAVASVVFLLLGLNATGYVAGQALPLALAEDLHLSDEGWRYTPFFWKLVRFNQMPMSLGAFAAILWLMGRDARLDWRGGRGTVVFLLLVLVGILYPILAPACLALVIARILVDLLPGSREAGRRSASFLGGLLVAALAITFLHLRWITGGHDGGAIRFSWDKPYQSEPWRYAARKAWVLGVAALPYLPALIGLRQRWRDHRCALGVALLGAMASIALHLLFWLPNIDNEYKYAFTFALCAAPLAGAACDRALERLRRSGWALIVVAAVLLTAPVAEKLWRERDYPPAPLPRLASLGFQMALAPDEPLAGALAAIREHTPPDTVLFVDEVPWHLPPLVTRHLWVPPREADILPGAGLSSRFILLAVRGHDAALFDSRVEERRNLFRRANPEGRRTSVDNVLALGRPVALLLDKPGHDELAAWLEAETRGRVLYEDARYRVWLLPARAAFR